MADSQLEDQTNNAEPGAKKRGRPKGTKTNKKANTAGDNSDALTIQNLLARMNQFETAAALRDQENELLRQELATCKKEYEQVQNGQQQCSTQADTQGQREASGVTEGSNNEPPQQERTQAHAHRDAQQPSGTTNTPSAAPAQVTSKTNENPQMNPVQLAALVQEPCQVKATVPKPHGQAGKDYSICVEMGLATTADNQKKYKALLRDVREAVMQSRLPWQNPWAEIPAADKAMVLAILRTRHPILQRFINDWATVDIIRQYLKNKRKPLYRTGELTVPEKYAHLKNNAANRDQSKSRKSKASAVHEARKKEKKQEKREARKAAK